MKKKKTKRVEKNTLMACVQSLTGAGVELPLDTPLL